MVFYLLNGPCNKKKCRKRDFIVMSNNNQFINNNNNGLPHTFRVRSSIPVSAFYVEFSLVCACSPIASGVFSRFSGFIFQFEDMLCLYSVWMGGWACVCVFPPRWVGTISRMSPAMCLKAPGISSHDSLYYKQCRKWMDWFWTCSCLSQTFQSKAEASIFL